MCKFEKEQKSIKKERKAYKKQRNDCANFIRKAKQTFFGNINTTDVTDNKTFCRTV